MYFTKAFCSIGFENVIFCVDIIGYLNVDFKEWRKSAKYQRGAPWEGVKGSRQKEVTVFSQLRYLLYLPVKSPV